MVEAIERDIIERHVVQWEDIASLDDAKRLLQEAVVLPQVLPQFFTGIREPWKGVLLFGPPGTGKTMLAKAVASQAKTTFFNVSASTLVSKFHGESEKMVRLLFEMARHYAPSTIFFDEIDALMTSRGGGNEHDASRRLKAEMLAQMDGVGTGSGLVMVLATTNTPWDLDEALRRRLEKRIYIPLPDTESRRKMFDLHLATVKIEGVDVGVLAERTEGFSGADIKLLCREACMVPMRRLMATHSPTDIADMDQRGELTMSVLQEDFDNSLQGINSSVGKADIRKYEEWSKQFGSV